MSEDNKRKAMRLRNYDYSSNGAYFITVCVKDMKRVLSDVVGADDLGSPQIRLTKYGRIVENNILKMNGIYSNVNVDTYVVMPNHIHFILSVTNGAPGSSPPTNTVSKFVTALKKFTNKEIGKKIWQRGFYDHIIRNDEDYNVRSRYIEENPAKWLLMKDEYYIK